MLEFASLKTFEFHGAHFDRQAGDQAVGDCPFCEKPGHFYVNIEKKLWDCKRCGRKGNLNGFLAEVCKRNESSLGEEQIRRLAIDRKLPLSAFRGWGIGWDGGQYTIPVKDFGGRVVDVRCFRLGAKARATSGGTLGLLGAERLAAEPRKPVYVCEGEWDGLALSWLCSKVEGSGIVVAVPGASVFKGEWVPWFEGREVYALHDNDGAGEAGRKLVSERLSGIAKTVKCISWPSGLPNGFDVRDLVVQEAIRGAKPRATWSKIARLCAEAGSASTNGHPPELSNGNGDEHAPAPPSKPRPFSAEATFKAYQKWLHLSNDESLRIMFGAVFANKMQGDPIWLFLVAPPGGSKSELLSSLSRSPLVESTTSLTPHALVSGAPSFNGKDPSLLPKLNNRILVIKDFTTILSMHFSSRDEIFGTLRDAYDGSTTKTFGTGLKRTYVSHFGIIAGVTPKIEEFGVVHQSLGERFIKYRISTGQKNLSEADRIRRALGNINRENQMRDDLCAAANPVLEQPLPANLPAIPPEIFECIINLAQCCAMMRGVVDRDRFTQQVIYRPSIEVGTRIAKQLAKLGIGIACYLKRPTVDLEIYRLVRKVAMDTAPDRIEIIIRSMWKKTEEPGQLLNTNDISMATRLPIATCFRVLQDLDLLNAVDRVGTGTKFSWKLNDKMLKLIQGGRVYEAGKP